jgi:16S rRNA (adenine1518-N6/adenine1519-N6)-dimethyltransferase
MIKILKERFKDEKIEIINDDILKVDLKTLVNSELLMYKAVKVVANLPYYITTPIIMKLLEEKLNIKEITVMVQKEVGERLVTRPGTGDTGAITYGVNYFTNPTKVIDVPKEAFLPEPKVESCVINLKVLDTPKVEVKNEEKFFKIIKIAFMQKRKTILNSFTNGGLLENKLQIEDMLQKLNIDKNIRAEKLSLEDFAQICNYID